MNKCRILVSFQPLNNAVDASIESTLTTSQTFNICDHHLEKWKANIYNILVLNLSQKFPKTVTKKQKIAIFDHPTVS